MTEALDVFIKQFIVFQGLDLSGV